MTETVAGEQVRKHPRGAFWLPTALLYTLSLLAVLTLSNPVYVAFLSLVLACAVGAAIPVLAQSWNVWVLFTVGFIQPVVLGLPNATFEPEVAAAAFSLGPPVIIGAACAMSGVIAATLQRRLSKEAFSIQPWLDWVWPFRTSLGWVEQVVRTIGTIAAAATLIRGFINLLR